MLVQVHGDLGSGLNSPLITKDLGEIDKVSGPADKILLMYRDGDIKPEAGESHATIVVAKNCGGALRSMTIKFNARSVRFEKTSSSQL